MQIFINTKPQISKPTKLLSSSAACKARPERVLYHSPAQVPDSQPAWDVALPRGVKPESGQGASVVSSTCLLQTLTICFPQGSGLTFQDHFSIP